MSGISVPRRGRPRPGVRHLLWGALLLFQACAQAPVPEGSGPPGASALNIRTSPSGARIALDGEQSRLRSPAMIPSLPPGEHFVSLTMRGYRPWENKVLVGAGETVNLDAHLEPVDTGSLSVSSIPFMSFIFIDGRPTPYLTPATIPSLPVGTHTVLLRRDGYEDWSHAVVVMENRQMTLKASMKPALGSRGALDVRSTPPLAEVVVDGYPTGSRTPAVIFNLLPGLHVVELKKEGHQSCREEVTIPEGGTYNLLVALRRAEERLAGSARIDSSPSGAEVILDEVRLSALTPVRFDAIAYGTHALEVRKTGYVNWRGEIRIRPGERTELSVELVPDESGAGGESR